MPKKENPSDVPAKLARGAKEADIPPAAGAAAVLDCLSSDLSSSTASSLNHEQPLGHIPCGCCADFTTSFDSWASVADDILNKRGMTAFSGVSDLTHLFEKQ